MIWEWSCWKEKDHNICTEAFYHLSQPWQIDFWESAFSVQGSSEELEKKKKKLPKATEEEELRWGTRCGVSDSQDSRIYIRS